MHCTITFTICKFFISVCVCVQTTLCINATNRDINEQFIVGQENRRCQSNVYRRKLYRTFRDMQRAIIFVLSLFVTVTIGMNADFAEGVAQALSISRSDVETCMNKTNVQLKDLENLDELVVNNIQTDEINKSASKVGCLFACIAQKTELMSGARFNQDKLKEIADTKTSLNTDPKFIAERNRVIDLCADRVKSKTNECEVAIQYMICLSGFFGF